MKKLKVVLGILGCLLLSSIAWAARPTNVLKSEVRTGANQNVDEAPFAIGTSMFSVADRLHIGIIGKWESTLDPATSQLSGGVQTGFLYGPGDVKTWVIPVQGLLTYDFEPAKEIGAYLGVGMGFTILHYGKTKIDLPTYTFGGMTFGGGSIGTEAGTTVKFAATLRPGLHFGKMAWAEFPIGSVQGTLAFGLMGGVRL